VLPWRPPQNRDPKPEEIAMLLPFVERHVALADPELVVLMGNISCQAASGAARASPGCAARGREAYGCPRCRCSTPPTCCATPAAKREAWADLLSLTGFGKGPRAL
jgi:uracil-DNA glycosylase family 4